MSSWKQDEIRTIAASDDLHVSPFREDGHPYGTPTWIWSVVVGGILYVRPYNGTASRWYKAAMQQQAGRITIAGPTKEVTFVDASRAPQSDIDAAYREKYSKSPYLASMIGDRATVCHSFDSAAIGDKLKGKENEHSESWNTAFG